MGDWARLIGRDQSPYPLDGSASSGSANYNPAIDVTQAITVGLRLFLPLSMR